MALTDWPGKSGKNGGIDHPAAYHMLDVAAVAESLIAPEDFSHELKQALIFLTALHDVGKISAGFRAMLLEGKSQPMGRHWEMSEYLLHHHDDLLEEYLDGKPIWRKALYASVSGHHGRPPQLDLQLPHLPFAIGNDAIRDAGLLIREFASLWPDASLSGMTKEQARALNWWLPGFVSAADWIGSNVDWFPATPAEFGFAEYLAQARQKQLTAVNCSGLGTPDASDTVLFDFAFRPMQQACSEISIPPGPMLAIIEDETGSGKTEAALILAQRMMAAGKGRGLFFALPTTATSDAMFSRARKMLRRMFTDPPSIALAHGRAGISCEYRALRAVPTQPTDEPVCTDWLAENRRRALLANIGIGTVDQAIFSVLPTKFNTLRHYGLASKILIVDEVHEMGDPYMVQELARLLQAHHMAGGSAILLTATLPLDQRRQLQAGYRAQDDGDPAYPALTVAGREVRRNFSQTGASRGPVVVRRLASESDAVALIAQQAGQGAACLWVRNVVDDAIAAVDRLRAGGIDAGLLHARFALCDRLDHEAAALARFGKQGAGREGHVLVATQIVESSLDLDFDVMVSDLAPIASLVQRAGRLWRHMDLRPASGRPMDKPVLSVLSPDPEQVTDKNWLLQVLDKGAWVYPLDLQWRTARVLFKTGVIDAPSGLRALIEAVHGEGDTSLPESMIAAEAERQGQGFAAANQARRNMIDLERGYRDGGAAVEDSDYPTRLGLPQQRVMLARNEGGALQPYAGTGNDDSCQLSELQVSLHRLSQLELPDQSSPEIAALTMGWPEWRRHQIKVLPAGAEGAICPGLSYSADRGLMLESK